MGLRSSWEASLTKLRWVSVERSNRARVSLVVAARAAISSPVPGWWTRRPRSPAVMAASWVRMRSTGRSAWPTAVQAATATMTSRVGTETASVR